MAADTIDPIPVVDMSGFIAGGPGAGHMVETIRTAATESGLFLVTGHGVDQAPLRPGHAYANFLISPKIQQMLMRQFFTSPTHSKVTVPDELKEQVPTSGDGMAAILQWDREFVNENQTDLSERWAREVG